MTPYRVLGHGLVDFLIINFIPYWQVLLVDLLFSYSYILEHGQGHGHDQCISVSKHLDTGYCLYILILDLLYSKRVPKSPKFSKQFSAHLYVLQYMSQSFTIETKQVG